MKAISIIGSLLIAGVVIYVFYFIVRQIINAIEEKNYKFLINELLIALVCIVLCVFLVKPLSGLLLLFK